MNNEEKQQRETKQRRLILEIVKKHLDHPDANDIYMDVCRVDKRISKATVYRNLRLLAKNGEISDVILPGADRFDSTVKKHYHVICSVCGKVMDAPIEYDEENDSIVEAKTGFKINVHHALFEGICPECQIKK